MVNNKKLIMTVVALIGLAHAAPGDLACECFTSCVASTFENIRSFAERLQRNPGIETDQLKSELKYVIGYIEDLRKEFWFKEGAILNPDDPRVSDSVVGFIQQVRTEIVPLIPADIAPSVLPELGLAVQKLGAAARIDERNHSISIIS